MRRTLTGRGSIMLCAAAIVLFVGLLSVPPVLASNPPQWSEPEMLSDPEQSSWFPEVNIDPAGTPRIIWETYLPDLEEARRTDATAADVVVVEESRDGWSSPSTVYVKDAYNAGRPILASDERYVHLIGRALRVAGANDGSIHNLAGLSYMRAPVTADLENIQSWTPPVPLSTGAAYWADIEVLPDGGLVVIYNETATIWTGAKAEFRTVLYSRRSGDYGATWGPPLRISTGSEWVVRTTLALAPDGETLIAAWDEGYDNMSGQSEKFGVFTAVSPDGGLSWTAQTRVGDGNATDRLTSYAGRGLTQQSLVETDGETTILLYRSTADEKLLYRLSPDLGRTWSEENTVPDAVAVPFPGPHNFDKLGVAFDGDGLLLLAYVGVATGTPSGRAVMVTTFYEGEWSNPRRVAVHEGVPEYPRLAVALGNQVYLTYFLRTVDRAGEEMMSVWSVRGVSDAGGHEPGELVQVAEAPSLTTPVAGVGSAPDREGEPAPVDLVPFPERPPAPQPVAPDGLRTISPQATLLEPLYSVTGVTLVLLCTCALIIAAWRVTHSLRM